MDKRGQSSIEQPASSGRITSIRNPLAIIQKKKIKRVVLDSLTLFEFIYSTESISFRKGLIEFLDYMRKEDVIFLATSERRHSGIDNFVYEIQDFLFDGLIVLFRARKGSTFEKCINIMKLRGHDHLLDIFPFSIQKGGIVIYPEQLPFSLIEQK